MLRITIELVPFGVEDEKKILSQFLIYNTGMLDGDDTIYKISRSTTHPANTFLHHRPDGLFPCVIAGMQKAISTGLDKSLLL